MSVKRNRKTIALLGGSFNPPHSGHFEMACHLHEKLNADEIWFLFSNNIDKDPTQYVSLEHRMKMARVIGAHYKALPFVLSDVEYTIGTHVTADVLPHIEALYPHYRFIWAMGTDNLMHFHVWEGFEDIIKNYPIAILNRGHTPEDCAFQRYKDTVHGDAPSLKERTNGICFLDHPPIALSSTSIREALHSGEKLSMPFFDEIKRYVDNNGLYAL